MHLLIEFTSFNLYAKDEKPDVTDQDQPAYNLADHALSSKKLRTIMQNINLTIHDSTNVDTQTENIAHQDMNDMIEAIEELLLNTEIMPTDFLISNLNKNDIITFRALAGQLHTEALNIQQLSENYNVDTYDYELLNISYDRLNQTCAACHKLFRDN